MIRPVRDLCISSADTTYVFGPVEEATWDFEPPACGRITCARDPHLAQSLEATLHSPRPEVHVTFDCEGEMFHGLAKLKAVEPAIELEIIDSLVAA